MENNIYQAPSSNVMVEDESVQQAFYIVSSAKFLTLSVMTVGLYWLYWFYQHWNLYRQAYHVNLWPIPRAIFSIFFVASLFGKIEERIHEKKIDFLWNAGGWAGLYVIAYIANFVTERMSAKEIGSPYTDLIGLFLLIPLTLALYKAQMAANAACGDPRAESNKTFTAANIIWIVIGSLFWLLIAIGLIAYFVDLSQYL